MGSSILFLHSTPGEPGHRLGCRESLVKEEQERRGGTMRIEERLNCAARASDLLKGLSNRYRLLITCELSKHDCSVRDLEEILGFDQPMTKKEVKELALTKRYRKEAKELQKIHDEAIDSRFQTGFGLAGGD